MRRIKVEVVMIMDSAGWERRFECLGNMLLLSALFICPTLCIDR
jgi:hypothetical protein